MSILITNMEVVGWEHAIRGMRNSYNSWDKSDSYHNADGEFILGTDDLELMQNLAKAGPSHRKFMRMLTVYMDVTAPLYWWKEADTYKVGTVANSCSTMHKIAAKEFVWEDFSCDHLDYAGKRSLENTIKDLNMFRHQYLLDKDKETWWQMIQLLPSSYNQHRTWMLNYEVLLTIYNQRKNHRLDEWREFCGWTRDFLPYFDLITGVH